MIFPSWSRLLTWHICLLLGVILKIVKEILTFNPLKNHDGRLFFPVFATFTVNLRQFAAFMVNKSRMMTWKLITRACKTQLLSSPTPSLQYTLIAKISRVSARLLGRIARQVTWRAICPFNLSSHQCCYTPFFLSTSVHVLTFEKGGYLQSLPYLRFSS